MEKAEVDMQKLWDDYFAANRPEYLRNELVLQYQSLVRTIALQMRGMYKNYAQLEDIINQGILALMESIEKFDPERGFKFETFASIRVKGSVIDFIRSQDWVPRRARRQSRELETARDALFGKLGREPEKAELAQEMSVTVEQLDKILDEAYSFHVLSYEEIIYEKYSATFKGNADEDPTFSPESRMLEGELRQQLAASIDLLNERERTVVSLYYYENLKLKEIAYVMDVSESRVSQIHSAALGKLKKRMLDYAAG